MSRLSKQPPGVMSKQGSGEAYQQDLLSLTPSCRLGEKVTPRLGAISSLRSTNGRVITLIMAGAGCRPGLASPRPGRGNVGSSFDTFQPRFAYIMSFIRAQTLILAV